MNRRGSISGHRYPDAPLRGVVRGEGWDIGPKGVDAPHPNIDHIPSVPSSVCRGGGDAWTNEWKNERMYGI